MTTLWEGDGGDGPSVRPAVAADVDAVGAVQHRAWTTDYREVLPEGMLADLTPELLAEQWRQAVTGPPSDGRVLVACSGATRVGFAAVDGGGEIVALWVDPAHQRRGHGSRLLAAVADTARAQGTAVLSIWCPLPDEPRRRFLVSAGFEADGGLRELGWDGSTLREAHLVAALQPADGAS